MAAHDFVHIRAAEDIVDRLEVVLKSFPQAVICGPGAPHIAERLTPTAAVGEVILCDEIDRGTPFTCAPPHALPFESASVDLVVSSMALHAAEDLPGALREARRILKPDGFFLGIFPGERTLHELRDALQTAEAEVTGRVAPRIAPLVAVKDGGTLLQHAGFALPVSDVIRLPISYGNPMRLFSDLRGTGETSHLVAGPKGALRRDVLARALDVYQEKYPAAEGGIAATVDLITLTGWAPDKSQPQPLKPGSGKVSLAEAVKAHSTQDR